MTDRLITAVRAHLLLLLCAKQAAIPTKAMGHHMVPCTPGPDNNGCPWPRIMCRVCPVERPNIASPLMECGLCALFVWFRHVTFCFAPEKMFSDSRQAQVVSIQHVGQAVQLVVGLQHCESRNKLVQTSKHAKYLSIGQFHIVI